jgi:FAD/FMN-containing dehydrogenase
VTSLGGWGRFPTHETELVTPSTAVASSDLLARQVGLVARGNGRAYGDAAIGARVTLATASLDRMRRFDPDRPRTPSRPACCFPIPGRLRPARIFSPGGPGTKLVSVGGMIASECTARTTTDGGFGSTSKS